MKRNWKVSIELFQTCFIHVSLGKFEVQTAVSRSLQLVLVLPAQILGLLGPNFYMFQKHQKCVLYILTPNHFTKINFWCPTVFCSINKAELGPLSFFCYQFFWSSKHACRGCRFQGPGVVLQMNFDNCRILFWRSMKSSDDDWMSCFTDYQNWRAINGDIWF